MATFAEIATTAIAGILSGGTSSLTTVLAVFRDIRKRLSALEEKVGKDDGEKKSGLFEFISDVEKELRKLQKDIESFEETPPVWVSKLLRNRSQANLEIASQIEDALRPILDRIKRLEEHGPASSRRQNSDDNLHKYSDEQKQIKDNLVTLTRLVKNLTQAMSQDKS